MDWFDPGAATGVRETLAQFKQGVVVKERRGDCYGHVVGFARSQNGKATLIKVLWDDEMVRAFYPIELEIA